jgi:hypothetical protein
MSTNETYGINIIQKTVDLCLYFNYYMVEKITDLSLNNSVIYNSQMPQQKE